MSVTVRTESFETFLGASQVVVLGKIIESPIGVLDPKLGVRTHHTIEVEQYVKGEGHDEITVVTLGGKYWKDTDQGRKLYEGTSEIHRLVIFRGLLKEAEGGWMTRI